MKIAKLFFAVVVLMILATLSSIACSRSVKPLTDPDKIVVYKEGKTTIVEKNSEDFKKIFDLTLKRFTSKTAGLLMARSPDNWESGIKEQDIGIEFVYESEQKLGNQYYSFTRLFFPLTGGDSDVMWLGHNGKILPGPQGPLEPSTKLMDFLKKFN